MFADAHIVAEFLGDKVPEEGLYDLAAALGQSLDRNQYQFWAGEENVAFGIRDLQQFRKQRDFSSLAYVRDIVFIPYEANFVRVQQCT